MYLLFMSKLSTYSSFPSPLLNEIGEEEESSCPSPPPPNVQAVFQVCGQKHRRKFGSVSSDGMFFPPDKLDLKRRRTERIRRERIDSSLTNDMENRRRSRANSQSDPIRRGRGRPKTVGLKKQEEDKGNSRPGALNQRFRAFLSLSDVNFGS